MSEFLFFLLSKEDQTGCIKGHSSANSIGKLLHIIQFSHQQKMDRFVVSRDTEKVFDRVEWSYFINYLNSV